MPVASMSSCGLEATIDIAGELENRALLSTYQFSRWTIRTRERASEQCRHALAVGPIRQSLRAQAHSSGDVEPRNCVSTCDQFWELFPDMRIQGCEAPCGPVKERQAGSSITRCQAAPSSVRIEKAQAGVGAGASSQASNTGTPFLVVRIARNAKEKASSAGFTHSKSDQECELFTTQCPLRSLIGFLTGGGGKRLEMNEKLASECYDVEYAQRVPAGQSANYDLLIKNLCEALNITIEAKLVRRDIWVVRTAGARLRAGTGNKGFGPDKRGTYRFKNIGFEEFMRVVESRFKCLIESDVRLEGTFDFEFPNQANWEEFRRHMKSAYGLIFEEESRPVSITQVERRANVPPSTTTQKQTRVRSANEGK